MSAAVECLLCPRHCRLKEGDRGNCRVRTNIGGKLFSLVYGKPCAVHVDPIEKKPFYHMLPGTASFSIATAGCNLHCQYCQNWEISQRAPEDLDHIDLPPQAVVETARRYHCSTIAYTYTDPVIFYEYAYDSSVLAKEQGLRNLLVTAGYIEQQPLIELCKVTHGANVDIKGMSDDFYNRMSQGTLKPVLDCVLTMKKHGLWVEITNLIVPTWNDRDEDIIALCRWLRDYAGRDTPVHFSRFTPMHKLAHLPPTPTETLRRARQIALAEGLEFVYTGNLPDDDGNNTYCPACGKLLIRRLGFQIFENHMHAGTCGYCSRQIAGVWTP